MEEEMKEEETKEEKEPIESYTLVTRPKTTSLPL